MRLWFFKTFSLLALTTGPALADSCVKVRQGESDICMKFPLSQKRDAAKLGLRLGDSFNANKEALLKQGWVPDKQWLSEDNSKPFNGGELTCGSGWDAVCQTAFIKNKVVLVLTLSAVNQGRPLIAAEAIGRAAPAPDLGRTLTTRSFIIRIKVNCAEGNVTCDNVTYVGTSKNTGKSITLRGKTKSSMCADRVTPCGFQGYEFWNGQTYYRVLDNGNLSVMQKNSVLLEERGSWK